MAGLKIEKLPDGTISLTGLTPDEAWLIYSGLSELWTERDDSEASRLANDLSDQLEASGYGD